MIYRKAVGLSYFFLQPHPGVVQAWFSSMSDLPHVSTDKNTDNLADYVSTANAFNVR